MFVLKNVFADFLHLYDDYRIFSSNCTGLLLCNIFQTEKKLMGNINLISLPTCIIKEINPIDDIVLKPKQNEYFTAMLIK